MPLYEYLCLKCNKEFFSFRPVKKREKAKCPQCGTIGKKVPAKGVAIHDPKGRFHN